MLTAVVALGFVDPWMILGFSFLIACGGALNDPAWQASVGDMTGFAKKVKYVPALLKRSIWPREPWTYLVWAFSKKMLFTRTSHRQLIILGSKRDGREHGRK